MNRNRNPKKKESQAKTKLVKDARSVGLTDTSAESVASVSGGGR